MPGATLVTLITIDEAFLTSGALDLELVGGEQLSPYNARLRLLASETPNAQHALAAKATLVDIIEESKQISTFTFALPMEPELAPAGTPSSTSRAGSSALIGT